MTVGEFPGELPFDSSAGSGRSNVSGRDGGTSSGPGGLPIMLPYRVHTIPFLAIWVLLPVDPFRGCVSVAVAAGIGIAGEPGRPSLRNLDKERPARPGSVLVIPGLVLLRVVARGVYPRGCGVRGVVGEPVDLKVELRERDGVLGVLLIF